MGVPHLLPGAAGLRGALAGGYHRYHGKRERPGWPAVIYCLLLLVLAVPSLHAQSGRLVLLVVNRKDPVSREIGDYYRPRRGIPAQNVCSVDAPLEEEIGWNAYQQAIEKPVANCLTQARLQEQILYIVLAMSAPLKVQGGGFQAGAEHASVDSELALLYTKLHGGKVGRSGGVANPLFMRRDEPFRHPRFPIYLVTRLAAYDAAEAKAMIDRSLAARNRGKFVIDLDSSNDKEGNNWLRTAALLLPAARVVLDQTSQV